MKSLSLRYYFYCVLILLVVCAAYHHTLNFPFQFDDKVFIVDNVAIRNIHNTNAIWNAVLYQPSRFVGFLSFALNYHLHGLQVMGYRLVNIGIHLLNGLMLFQLYLQILRTHRFEKLLSKQRMTIAGLGAILFCAHPLQTQAVTYLSQRFASLATFFYLAALVLYFLARASLSKRFRIFSFLGCVLLGLLGMFTKEIVITLPLMIAFLESAFIKRKSERYSKGMMCIFLMIVLVGLCVIPSIFSFKAVSILTTPRMSASHDGDVVTLWPYLLTQSRVWTTFLRLFFFPVGQNIDYDFMLSQTIWHIPTLASLSIILLLLWSGVKSFSNSPWLSFGALWFLISLSANLIPRRHVIFEHKMYLASIGLCFFLAYVLAQIKHDRWRKCVITGIVLLLIGLSYSRNNVWRSEVSLWQDAAKQSSRKYRPIINLSSALIQAARYPDAMTYANQAVRLDPKKADAYNNRGIIFYKLKKPDLALLEHNQAIILNPNYFKYYHDRGVAFKHLGQFEKALSDFSKSILINNNNARAYRNRADIYFFLKQYDQALRDFDKAIFVQPDYVEAYNNRGLTHSARKSYARALKDFEYCLQLNPHFADAYNNAAFIFLKENQLDSAVKYLTRAISVKPDYAEAFANRAMVYRKQHRYDLAMQDIIRALAILPRYEQAKLLKVKIQQDLNSLKDDEK